MNPAGSQSYNETEGIHLDKIEGVISHFRSGGVVIIVDDADRENEGDLVVATEAITAESVAFMMQHGRGLICVSIPSEVSERLNLPLQVLNNNSPFQTPFAITVDHREVALTGVAAASRALTMREMINPNTKASDFVSPGHNFPLIAHKAGVMGRDGQTEGSHDLAKLAGFYPSGVICEILAPDGTMLRGSDLVAFARAHSLPITSVDAIRTYRRENERAVRETSRRVINTEYGDFFEVTFADDVGGLEHIAFVRGDLSSIPASYIPLVRLHSECLTGDVFGSRRCDCGPQLAIAMRLIAQEGSGVLLYLRQEGRGIGLLNKVKAYALQDAGLDTVEANEKLGFRADERDFAVGARMLQALGVEQVRLLTNNPEKVGALEKYGVVVSERLPVIAPQDDVSFSYLKTKREKLGHLL